MNKESSGGSIDLNKVADDLLNSLNDSHDSFYGLNIVSEKVKMHYAAVKEKNSEKEPTMIMVLALISALDEIQHDNFVANLRVKNRLNSPQEG
jgi:hypothetical protein